MITLAGDWSTTISWVNITNWNHYVSVGKFILTNKFDSLELTFFTTNDVAITDDHRTGPRRYFGSCLFVPFRPPSHPSPPGHLGQQTEKRRQILGHNIISIIPIIDTHKFHHDIHLNGGDLCRKLKMGQIYFNIQNPIFRITFFLKNTYIYFEMSQLLKIQSAPTILITSIVIFVFLIWLINYYPIKLKAITVLGRRR